CFNRGSTAGPLSDGRRTESPSASPAHWIGWPLTRTFQRRGSEMNNWTVKLCRTLVFAVWWLVCAEKATAQDAVWTTYGPYGGIIEAIAIDPQTPTTLYAGAPCTGGTADLTGRSGVFKSIDGGGSWRAANTLL